MSEKLIADCLRSGMEVVLVDPKQLARLDSLIECLIELRDLLDGTPDLEDGDEDRCEACDDHIEVWYFDGANAQAGISGPAIWAMRRKMTRQRTTAMPSMNATVFPIQLREATSG